MEPDRVGFEAIRKISAASRTGRQALAITLFNYPRQIGPERLQGRNDRLLTHG
jgi:hypothetical protein